MSTFRHLANLFLGFLWIGINPATPDHTIVLSPQPGDCYRMIQDAVNFSISNPGARIILNPGTYSLSHPIICANLTDLYRQCSVDIEGLRDARNAPYPYVVNWLPTFRDAPCLILQQCKGCIVKNISFTGKYTLPNTLNAIQIDTLPYAAWKDGLCSDGRTNPYTAIAIDPFSDPGIFDGVQYKMYDGLRSYYLTGMNRSGSTAVTISGCAITNFPVGIAITPSNQQNGELIDMSNDRIDHCKVGIASTQAQSKTNTVTNLESWGGVYTLIDAGNYGVRHGDGATCPMIDVVNLAGFTHQLIFASSMAFPITVNRVYGEGLWKIGTAGGFAGTHFENFQIDFQNSVAGVPSPDFYFFGHYVKWDACMLRMYPGVVTTKVEGARIVLNCTDNRFSGGSMTGPPFVGIPQIVGGAASDDPPVFDQVTMYYSGKNLSRNDYDSVVSLPGGPQVIHVDRAHFSGYFLDPSRKADPGDLLITQKRFEDQFSNNVGTAVPVGFVTGRSRDTVLLENVGVGLHTGDRLTIWTCKLKKGGGGTPSLYMTGK